MQKPISRKMHALADYSFVPLALAAPVFLSFKNNTATTLAWSMGAAVLGQSLLTQAEWGAVKVIPMKQHLQADLALGVFSVAAPWLFGFADQPRTRNAFLGMGLIAIAASVLTEASDAPLKKSKALAHGHAIDRLDSDYDVRAPILDGSQAVIAT